MDDGSVLVPSDMIFCLRIFKVPEYTTVHSTLNLRPRTSLMARSCYRILHLTRALMRPRPLGP
jgi:hypothetical protein